MKHLELLGFNDEQQVADVVQAIEPSMIKSDKMRAQLSKLRKKNSGFTLLELLVVVAILAVLGGLAIGAFGDKTSGAAKSSATNTIASVSNLIQMYQSTARLLPNNLDTLICANPTDAAQTINTTIEYGGTSDLPAIGGGMGKKLADKLTPTVFPAVGAAATDPTVPKALSDAGITSLRYGAHVSNTESSCDDTGTGVFGGLFPNSPLSQADIPNLGFNEPTSATQNRGRGFSVTTTAFDRVLQVWNPGVLGANNTKLGAKADDVLVAFGLGNNAAMFTDETGNRVGNTAPFYGDVAKDKYSRYVALLKVATGGTVDATGAFTATGTPLSKAKFAAIIDSRGDFLDEEYAEATGQKQ